MSFILFLTIWFACICSYCYYYRTKLNRRQQAKCLQWGLTIGLVVFLFFVGSPLSAIVLSFFGSGAYVATIAILWRVYGEFPYVCIKGRRPKGAFSRVFISHSSVDKPVVKQLALDLEKLGYKVWFDQWELRVGDNILNELEEGIDQAGFVIVVLSRAAADSEWVDREWKYKHQEEIERNQTVILPVRIEECRLPKHLTNKRFSDLAEYPTGLADLVRSMALAEWSETGDPVENFKRLASHPVVVWGAVLAFVGSWALINSLGDPNHWAHFWVHVNCIAMIPLATLIASFIRPIWAPTSAGLVVFAQWIAFFLPVFLIQKRSDVVVFEISTNPKEHVVSLVALTANCLIITMVNWGLRKRRL